MSSDEQSAVAFAFQVYLLGEIVLDVLETTAWVHRVEDIRWSLSLQLISRAVRRSTLPILYETLVLDVRNHEKGIYVGWDGREHDQAQMAFLAWLLNNPDAPPRCHVKHLVFRHYTGWKTSELASSYLQDGRWTVDRLTL